MPGMAGDEADVAVEAERGGVIRAKLPYPQWFTANEAIRGEGGSAPVQLSDRRVLAV